MANNCFNSIELTGPSDVIRDLYAASQDGRLLDHIRPLPANAAGIGALAYMWRLDAWGTRSDAYDSELTLDDNGDGTSRLYGVFCTAWAPPVAAFRHLAASVAGLTIDLEYREENEGFCGIYRWEGEVEVAKEWEGTMVIPTRAARA